ncbi:MAG: SpoIID/LytB domain-containing protein, partial [Clostridiales bacterium]|nr:SpoIID/LytB domain-containing protein [Clostridiales bacterium]
MRSVVAAALVLVLLAFLLPLLFWSEAPMAAQAEPGGRPAALPVSSAGREAADPAPAAGSWDSVTSLQVYLSEEETVTLTMSDYLWRVVAAEMPASFEPEALKAQAVAARTYTAARLDRVHTRHPDAALCGNSACCQAYIEPADAAARWGGSAAVYTERIAAAVADTDGMVILYDGVPIDAVFHSSSAGRTMDAVAVWGGNVPYLTGVESPEG